MLKKIALAIYFVLFVVLLGPGLALGLMCGLFYGFCAAVAFVLDFGQTVEYPTAIPVASMITALALPWVMSKMEEY